MKQYNNHKDTPKASLHEIIIGISISIVAFFQVKIWQGIKSLLARAIENPETTTIIQQTQPSAAEQHPTEKGIQISSQAATFFTIIAGLIAVVPITSWLFSSSQIAKDQSRVELANQLVNQAYVAIQENIDTPICFRSSKTSVEFVICDTQKLIAMDDYELDENGEQGKLILRHFYHNDHPEVYAVDQYNYDENQNLFSKKRTIFYNFFGVIRCAYFESTYSSSGLLFQNKFNGFCGSDMVEIPTSKNLHSVSYSPPPITIPPSLLFMPYR